jgi:hypothetical protein
VLAALSGPTAELMCCSNVTELAHSHAPHIVFPTHKELDRHTHTHTHTHLHTRTHAHAQKSLTVLLAAVLVSSSPYRNASSSSTGSDAIPRPKVSALWFPSGLSPENCSLQSDWSDSSCQLAVPTTNSTPRYDGALLQATAVPSTSSVAL